MDWSHLAWELSFKTRYLRKEEGGIEVMGRQGRRRKLLLGDIKETRGYLKLEEKALYCTLWRILWNML